MKLGDDCNFTSFISAKAQKCNFILRNLTNLKECLTFNSKVTLVTNLILSSLDYCNCVLAWATDEAIKPLTLALNRSVRFIFKLKRRDHITEYLYKLHFLPIRHRIKFKLCIMAFKVVNGLSPGYLIDEFKMFEATTTANLRVGVGRDNRMFDCTLAQRRQKTIKTKLILDWNDLPYEMRKETSIEIFKSKLKTYYFRKAFKDILRVQESR